MSSVSHYSCYQAWGESHGKFHFITNQSDVQEAWDLQLVSGTVL
jgi:hypothetical protein